MTDDSEYEPPAVVEYGSAAELTEQRRRSDQPDLPSQANSSAFNNRGRGRDNNRGRGRGR